MDYPITNEYMRLNADRLGGADSALSQHLRAAIQEVEDHMNAALRKAIPAPLEPVNFDLIHPLPRWTLEPSYAQEVTVEFDGAEGGAVWINSDDEAIAIRGPEAMRELARMLILFADGYTGEKE